jgi:pimeloyl-ACP methyl ester carboxylesterase
MIRRLTLAAALLATLAAAPGALADPMLADFDYPFPVQRFDFSSQGQDLSMAYMDVQPEKPNGRTVVLLHGKNFCGATWEGVMRPLLQAGYRVVAPDQVGFCKSTKPQAYQFGLHQLAANTKALLDSLGIQRPVVMGHSMGGMLAMRSTYYAGEWRPDYDRWVQMLAGMYQGEGGRQVAWDQALTSDMVFNQPVIYELEHIRAPTVLMIGERDTTAIGKALAPPEVAQRLGNYAELSRSAAKRIPGANLIRFPGEGHAPQIQSPEAFNKALLGALERFPPP